ncbi:MAG: hypothetical protein FWB78_09730 [Treponema sp.]|nr:hypothetical protein [Treponema sp.]
MKRTFATIVVLTLCAGLAVAQARPTLVIAPFVGGAEGEGYTIASLISVDPGILRAFTVIMRPPANGGRHHSETGIGRMLNAEYVLEGRIHQLGNGNLLTVAIVNVQTFRVVAGYHLTYRSIADFRRALPSMSANMVNSVTRRDTQRLSGLAILPFVHHDGVSRNEAEMLERIFAAEILSTGRYAVLSRSHSMQAAFNELEFQASGWTDPDTAALHGMALNAGYVLSGSIYRLGGENVLIVAVINVETFEQVAGDHILYRSIGDAIGFLPSMARSIATAPQRRGAQNLPLLAVTPFVSRGQVDAHSAQILAQVLATEILNTGRYVVLPRTDAFQAAIEEQDFQMQGFTSDEGVVLLGNAAGADFVLAGEITESGGRNMLTVRIVNILDGCILAGTQGEYRTIGDGIRLMTEIATFLTDPLRLPTVGIRRY